MSNKIERFEVAALQSFGGAFDGLREAGLLTPALSMEQLDSALNDAQRQVVQQLVELKPEDYGVDIPYVGLEPVPADLVTVSGQQYADKGEIKTLRDQLVPRLVYDAFKHMSEAFQAEHAQRALLIESGYRSPAMQVITFIGWCLNVYGGDIAQTIRHASPPAYSQHTSATKTALDIKNIDGLPTNETPEDFKHTVEYTWLQQHASRFNFYESWPENNAYGMRAEPWHWQYLPD